MEHRRLSGSRVAADHEELLRPFDVLAVNQQTDAPLELLPLCRIVDGRHELLVIRNRRLHEIVGLLE